MSPRVREIIARTAQEHRMPASWLLAGDRTRPVAYARFQAIQRARALVRSSGEPLLSLPKLAKEFGYRDHTTVLHALRRADKIFGPAQPVVVGGIYYGGETQL